MPMNGRTAGCLIIKTCRNVHVNKKKKNETKIVKCVTWQIVLVNAVQKEIFETFFFLSCSVSQAMIIRQSSDWICLKCLCYGRSNKKKELFFVSAQRRPFFFLLYSKTYGFLVANTMWCLCIRLFNFWIIWVIFLFYGFFFVVVDCHQPGKIKKYFFFMFKTWAQFTKVTRMCCCLFVKQTETRERKCFIKNVTINSWLQKCKVLCQTLRLVCVCVRF